MEKYLYLTINIASIFVPFLASFYPKHAFYKQWKTFFIANTIVATIFIIWDIYFTNIGVWGFNDRYIIGKRFFLIPIEEIMFFFFIPYASVFVYFSITYLIKKQPFATIHQKITLFFALVLMVIGIAFINRLYTSITFILCSIFLLYNYFKKKDLSKIYFSYAITLVFFFIVNGILTGAITPEPVVWYNNNHNLGIRIITIPIEDVFYGFLLIAATIQIKEKLDLFFAKK